MKLITQEILNSTPKLYANDGKHMSSVKATAKFFTPWSAWTWYMTEYDPEQRLAFGLVVGHEIELGYFSLDELEQVRSHFGLGVERDIYFQPTFLNEIWDAEARKRS